MTVQPIGPASSFSYISPDLIANLDNRIRVDLQGLDDRFFFWGMDTYEGTSQDPASLHKYLYAEDDAVDRTDPSGLTPLTDFLLLLASKGVNITARAFGFQSHQLIQADIKSTYGAASVMTEIVLLGGRIDVLILPNQIYEIKPFGGTVDPEKQINKYIGLAGDMFGSPLVRGMLPMSNIIDGPLGLTELYYFTTSPGVIEYTAFPSVKLVGAAICFVVASAAAQMFVDLGASIMTAAATTSTGMAF